MPFEFSTAGKAAVAAIPVPAFSMESVRMRADARRGGERLRRFMMIGAFTLGTLAAAAVGAKVAGIDLWLNGDKAALGIRSLTVIMRPRAADFRAAVAHATFPVVYPVGLPRDAKLWMLGVSPKGAPSTIFLLYQSSRGSEAYSIFDASNVASQAPVGRRLGKVESWRVGGEYVIVPKGSIRADEMQRVQEAMSHATAEQSLADVTTRVLTIRVLGGLDRLGTAEKYAPADGDSILLGDAEVRSIPRRIAQRDIFYDVHSVATIAYKDGLPDFREQSHRELSRSVALDLTGMRAIESVMRDHPCTCYLLVNHLGGTYRIWTLPLAASEPVREYRVNAPAP